MITEKFIEDFNCLVIWFWARGRIKMHRIYIKCHWYIHSSFENKQKTNKQTKTEWWTCERFTNSKNSPIYWYIMPFCNRSFLPNNQLKELAWLFYFLHSIPNPFRYNAVWSMVDTFETVYHCFWPMHSL